MPVVIVNGVAGAGPVGIPDTPGQPASLKLDVLDTPPEAMKGELRRNDVIASYTVRAAEAIVLDAPIQATERLLPAGMALARVDIKDASGVSAILWCDGRRRFFGSLYSVDCLQDDGTGALRRRWTGHLFAWKDSLGVGSATLDATPLPAGTPTPHHSAKPEERPTGRIGYAYCDGDGVSGPPRFTTAASVDIGGGWIRGMPYTCTLGSWPQTEDHSIVQIDAIRLRVTPGNPLTYAVVSGMAAHQIVSASAGRPFSAQVTLGAVSAAPGAAPLPPPMHKAVRVLEPVGAPSFVASGLVAPGGDLLRISARHGLTGVLLNSVSYSGLFGGRTIPSGRAVYGVPMTNANAGNPGIVWCALDQNGMGITFSTCFPHDGIAYRWIDVPGPFATSFIWSATSIQASAPTVKLTFADIQVPLEVSYRFIGWRKGGEATVKMIVTAGSKSESDQTQRYLPSANGDFVLGALTERLRLRRADDGHGVLVEALPEPVSPSKMP